MRGVAIAPGVTAATFAAGPLFVVIGTITDSVTDPVHRISLDQLGWFVPALPLAALFGAFLAFLPNWVGAMLLGALGRGNDGARLPIFWTLIGGAAGGAMGAATGGIGSAVMAFVGAVCALICRWGTRWQD